MARNMDEKQPLLKNDNQTVNYENENNEAGKIILKIFIPYRVTHFFYLVLCC